MKGLTEAHVSRSSVCAADDAQAPHSSVYALAEEDDLERIIRRITAAGFLPAVAGGGAVWSVFSGVPVAVAASQWTGPRMTP